MNQAPGGAGGTTLFAGGLESTQFGPVGEGVYRSTDNGMSWTAVNSGLANTALASLAFAGTHLLAGTDGGGVFLSTDQGTSWVEPDSGLHEFETVLAFAAIDSNIFAAGLYGVYVSTNNGASWTPASTGPPLGNVSAFSVSGQDLIAGTYYTGIFRSTDSGTSWTAANRGLPSHYPVYALAVLPPADRPDGMDLFAGLPGGVFRSADAGATWIEANAGLPANTGVYALTASDTNLFAGTDHGVFLSTNNGRTWSAVGNGASGPNWVTALIVSRDGAGGTNLFAGTQGDGVFRSTNNGRSWSQTNTGMIGTSVSALDVSPLIRGSAERLHPSGGATLFAGTFSGGAFLSTDNGTSWTPSSNGWPRSQYDTTRSSSVNSFSCSGSKLFAGTFDGLFLCTDSGTSWTALGRTGLPANFAISTFVAMPNVLGGADLFAGIADAGTGPGAGVYHSTNSGDSWTTSNEGLPTEAYITAFAVDGVDVFAASGGGIFTTTNSGASWAAVSTGLPSDAHVSHLAGGGSTLFAGTYEGEVYVSTDNGASWVATISRIPTTSTILISDFAVLPNGTGGMNLFVSTQNDGIVLTTNNGASWTAVNDGLPSTWVLDIVVSGKYIFAGTMSKGVWRRALSDMFTGVDGGFENVPSSFVLEQNYPNPFNPGTTIRYALPQRSHVTLTVFNTLGQQVAMLVEGELEAGYHEVPFDAAALASGMYLYRLTAGGSVQCRKLLLVR